MKTQLIMIFVILLSACDTRYSPSEKMLQHKKTMSTEQAIEVVQKRIWLNDHNYGICGSRGFWFDNKSDMHVSVDRVSMLSYRRGKQLKKRSQNFDDQVVFEKQFYQYEFLFNNIIAINVYDDPLLLPVFPGCNKRDMTEEYRVIDLYAGKLNNLKFIVFEKDFDVNMAALSILMPDKPVIIK